MARFEERAKTGSQLLPCTPGHKNVPLQLSKNNFTHFASDFLVSAPASLVLAVAKPLPGGEPLADLRRNQEGFPQSPLFPLEAFFRAFLRSAQNCNCFLTTTPLSPTPLRAHYRHVRKDASPARALAPQPERQVSVLRFSEHWLIQIILARTESLDID